MAVNLPDARTPDPLREQPDADQFCDLVLNGGVASGVVYPWALLKLARHYRFKNIGGNSVGAMAAAIAAAAEYGRCHGVKEAFEPLRRMPLKLAEEDPKTGKTRLLRLFVPSPPLKRLFELFLIGTQLRDTQETRTHSGGVAVLLTLYGLWSPLIVMLLLAVGGVVWLHTGYWATGLLFVESLIVVGLLTCLLGAWYFWRDLHALAGNGYGLCTGRGQAAGEEGLVEWLHRGIQLSAGRNRDAPPLTFADLWGAPRFGMPGPAPLPGGLQPRNPGISLQMFASNVTLGRPVRLPLSDTDTRLFYDPEEWRNFFPDYLMRALDDASAPYAPASSADPASVSEADDPLRHRLRELPGGDMPIVVAARLSLCFPLLFSCVPVYAIDYEAPRHSERKLRRCLLSDGGLCTNFPIHLFDAAHPSWPTFALLLDNRLSKYENQSFWLPQTHLEGRADNWQRFVPGVEDDDEAARGLLARIGGLAGGIVLTMKDWNDRMTGRLPQVRNRIIRLALKKGEGQLNIAMPGERILRMAHEYGTGSGTELVKRFAPDASGPKPAWRDHLYVRSVIELRALQRHLRGYTQATQARGAGVPLDRLLHDAIRRPPLAAREGRSDPAGGQLNRDQCDALERAVRAVQHLEAELSACEASFGPYEPLAAPDLRLRPPL